VHVIACALAHSGRARPGQLARARVWPGAHLSHHWWFSLLSVVLSFPCRTWLPAPTLSYSWVRPHAFTPCIMPIGSGKSADLPARGTIVVLDSCGLV